MICFVIVSQEPQWLKADGFKPESYKDKLKECKSVIISIGSPPIPTFSQKAYEDQVAANGSVCSEIIRVSALLLGFDGFTCVDC